MTPENSRQRPELFLHDACLPDELKEAIPMADVLVLLKGWVESRRGKYHTMTLDLAIAEIERLRAVAKQRDDLLMTLADMLKLVDEWIPLISRESVVTEEEARLIERAQTVLARAAVARATGRQI